MYLNVSLLLTLRLLCTTGWPLCASATNLCSVPWAVQLLAESLDVHPFPPSPPYVLPMHPYLCFLPLLYLP